MNVKVYIQHAIGVLAQTTAVEQEAAANSVARLFCSISRSLDMADAILCRFKIREVANLASWYFKASTLPSSKSNFRFSASQFSMSWHKCLRLSTSTPFTFFTW